MKKTWPVFIILMFVQISCDNCTHRRSYDDFIEHLNEVDGLLEDSLLYRWRAWSRYDENNSDYLLWYDTGMNPLYDKYGEFCVVNAYNIITGSPIAPQHQIDTDFFCKFWGVEKDSLQVHIKTICKHIRDITDGYRINEMGFYRNGFCVFLSAHNDWGVVYQKEHTYSVKTQEYELMLLNNGYSRLGDTRFWVHKPLHEENSR